mmetsp:Transcript_1652/g.5295  ORF Transcript_1652/g.5295 Transcript_1652/m.5295 type:complete len:203 (+) Transcript_1652:276-884(+)
MSSPLTSSLPYVSCRRRSTMLRNSASLATMSSTYIVATRPNTRLNSLNVRVLNTGPSSGYGAAKYLSTFASFSKSARISATCSAHSASVSRARSSASSRRALIPARNSPSFVASVSGNTMSGAFSNSSAAFAMTVNASFVSTRASAHSLLSARYVVHAARRRLCVSTRSCCCGGGGMMMDGNTLITHVTTNTMCVFRCYSTR